MNINIFFNNLDRCAEIQSRKAMEELNIWEIKMIKFLDDDLNADPVEQFLRITHSPKPPQ